MPQTFPAAAPKLISLASELPPFAIDQTDAVHIARSAFGARMPAFETLARVFASTGIERRYSVVPMEWFSQSHDWSDRSAAYLDGAMALFEKVVTKALERAHLSARDVDTVVTVSSTGVLTPSLEARMLPRMKFRPDVRRVPIFGLGCAGGVTGFAHAARVAASEPDTTVLLVTVELCTLAFRLDRATKADLVSTALFGDGAAAAVFRRGRGTALGYAGLATEHLWPETIDIMGWSTDSAGLGVILSRSLPDFIATNYRKAFDDALARLGLERSGIERLVCHPGGTKVLEAIEAALESPIGSLDVERSVMRDCGNMSSPTVLFVLERALAAGLRGTALLAALGPGFVASFAAFHVADA